MHYERRENVAAAGPIPAPERGAMFQDGLYELHYRCDQHPDDAGSLLLVLRDGQLLGSDQWGGVVLGTHVFDQHADRHKIKARLQIPAGGMLVTDVMPRPEGSVIELALDLADTADGGSGVVDVGGQPVRIELIYKGPVPT